MVDCQNEMKSHPQWQVPGLAIAVVKDGEIVPARGYGVCEIGTERNVTADTAYQGFDLDEQLALFTALRRTPPASCGHSRPGHGPAHNARAITPVVLLVLVDEASASESPDRGVRYI